MKTKKVRRRGKRKDMRKETERRTIGIEEKKNMKVVDEIKRQKTMCM